MLHRRLRLGKCLERLKLLNRALRLDRERLCVLLRVRILPASLSQGPWFRRERIWWRS